MFDAVTDPQGTNTSPFYFRFELVASAIILLSVVYILKHP